MHPANLPTDDAEPDDRGETMAGPAAPRSQRRSRVGEVVGGCRIERELARGGMGVVYLATQEDGSQVALKLLLRRGDSEWHARFRREADIGQRLEHPGIVRVLRVGQHEGSDYLVMELIEGAQELNLYVREQGSDAQARVRLMLQVCDALQAAHEQGVIHRDLKPQNLLVTPAGQVKVVDFGVARDLEGSRLTHSGAMVGTPHYMAPEQVRHGARVADARSDVFALGVILYELIAGELPFRGVSVPGVLASILLQEMPDLRERAPQAPAGLPEAVTRALARDPDERYASAAELGRDLAGIVAGSGVSAETEGAVRLRRRRVRRRRLAVGAAALALLLGVGAGVVAVRSAGIGVDRLERARELERLARRSLGERTLFDEQDASVLASWRAEAAGLERPALLELLTCLEGIQALARDDVPAARAAAARTAGSGPGARALRGGVLLLEGKPGQAQALLRSSVEGGVNRPEVKAWLARAVVASAPAEAGRAVRDLEALAKLRPLKRVERLALVQGLQQSGRTARALHLLSELPAPPPELSWSLALAEVRQLLDRSDPQAALKHLAALAQGPWHASRRRALAERALVRSEPWLRQHREGTIKPAERTKLLAQLRAARALLGPDTRAPAGIDDLVKAVSRKRFDVDLAVAVADLAPRDVAIQRRILWELEGKELRRANRRKLLPLQYRMLELAQSDRERFARVLRVCDWLDILGQVDKAYALAGKLLGELSGKEGFQTERAHLLMVRGRVLRHKGRFTSALELLDEALTLSPGLGPARFQRAMTLEALRRYDEALLQAASFLRSAYDGTRDTDRAIAMVWDLGRPRKKRALVWQAVKHMARRRPHYGGWRVRCALLEQERGETASALKSLRRGIELLAADERAPKVPSTLLTAARSGKATKGLLRALEVYVEQLDRARKLGRGLRP